MGGGSSGDGVYVDSNINVLLQSNEFSSCNSLWVSSYEPLATLKKIDGGEEKKDGPMFGSLINDDNAEEDSGICFNSPMKKRRLTATQAQFLEKSFEVENKLDPERKVKLAKEVGLQPRQVAIWFQNRRAQFKNKQLEKDYDSLKARFDKLKEDYDSLVKEKEGLQNEVHSLKQKLVARKKGAAVGTMNSPSTELQTPVPNTEAVSKMPMAVRVPKQEDSSSAKTEPFDSDSPQSYLDPTDSSHVFETDQYQSDFSRDEHEEKIRLGSGFFTKFYHDPPANSCSFEFPGDDDQQFWSWTC